MTRLAIFSDSKCGIAVVAGPAGFAVFHIFHGRSVGTALRLEQIGMAFVAAKHIDVSRVRENHIAVILVFVENITGMAAGTVAGHAKRGITVMAGAAGRAVCHRIHGGMVAVAPRLEKVGMALLATKHIDMNFVAEHGIADAFGLDRDIASVTGDTVAGNAESLPPVVTSSAGPASLHQFHGDVVTVILLFEDTRVADITFERMYTVAKDDGADTFGLDGELVNHRSDTSHAYSMQKGNRCANKQ